MKHIKVKFVGGETPDFYKNSYIYLVLTKYFEVEISENPDFIISAIVPGKNSCEFAKYDCIRVLDCFGENASPDFGAFDYAIGWDDLTYGDRYFRYLLTMNYFRKYSHDELKSLDPYLFYTDRQSMPTKETRPYFCDFIYSHESSHGIREKLLRELQGYKHVEIAGSYLNNMQNGFRVKNYDEKKAFQNKCKFSIACEAVTQRGFTTEKILQPFLAGSIPIYYGNRDIARIFNEKAFINCHAFKCIEDAIDYVRYIDTHDEAYYEMLRQPVFVDPLLPYKMITGFEQFIIDTFSREPEEAVRRPHHYLGEVHSNCLKEYHELTNTKMYWIYRKGKSLKRKIRME